MTNALTALALIIDGMQAVNQLTTSLSTIAQMKARAEAEGRDISDSEIAGAKAMVDASTLRLKLLLAD